MCDDYCLRVCVGYLHVLHERCQVDLRAVLPIPVFMAQLELVETTLNVGAGRRLSSIVVQYWSMLKSMFVYTCIHVQKRYALSDTVHAHT